MKKRMLLPLALVVLLLYSCALADQPRYNTYAYSSDGWLFYMQTLYLPKAIVGQNLYVPQQGEGPDGDADAVPGFKGPSDIFIDADGIVYVADTGNNRIVQMDREGNLLKEIGGDTLKLPEGVCVGLDGAIYVADTGNAAIAVFEKTGRLRARLPAPKDPRLEGVMFTPTDVSIDERGYIFVLLKGGNEGLLIMNPEGKFQGYFGRNATQVTFEDKIKRLFFTAEQLATNSNAVAPSVTGMAVGGDGFVYTCTTTLKKGQLKKLNAKGVDIWDNKDTKVQVKRWSEARSAVSSLYVGQNGLIYALDNLNGVVIIYDINGSPLINFGAKLTDNDKRIGLFSDPVSISVAPDGTLMVLDKAYNGIHVFEPTTLMRNIITANYLYNDGRYQEAGPYWETILKANTNYYMANRGLGKIAYMQKDWPEAMAQMKKGISQQYYSDAMWRQRAETVQKKAGPVMAVLLIFIAAHLFLTKLLRFNLFAFIRKGLHTLGTMLADWLSQKAPHFYGLTVKMRFALGVLRHPSDTFYEATRRGKGSLASAFLWYAVFLTVMIFERAFTNFVFDPYGLRAVSLVPALLTYVMPVLLWITGNYLVGAITKGQGTLRGIIIAAVYALMPMILFTIPVTLLSNLFTKAEESIYWILRVAIYLWTGMLLFIQVKEIHGYDLGEALKNIFAILFVAAMTVVAMLTVGGILVQGFNFSNEFLRELLGYV